MSDFVIIQKPKWGQPCNGCGVCCRQAACPISVAILGSLRTPCVALEYDGEKYRCGVINKPSRYIGNPEFSDEVLSAAIAGMLHAGEGCDSFTPETDDNFAEFRAHMMRGL